MKNYIIIHGNVVYKVENVEYYSTNTHRRFNRNGEMILSVPLSSVLVMDGKGVTAQMVNGLKSGTGVNPPETKTTVIQSEDNFAEGMIVGGIIGTVLF